MEHQMIKGLEIGAAFSGVYHIDSIFVKKTTVGDDYTDLMIRDRSGVRNAKYWGVLPDVEMGFAFVAGQVMEYPQGSKKPSIVLSNVEPEEEPEDVSAYVDVVAGYDEIKARFEKARDEIDSLCKGLEDEGCVLLFDEIFSEKTFSNQFHEAPIIGLPAYEKRGGLASKTIQNYDQFMGLSTLFDFSNTEKVIGGVAALIANIGLADCAKFEGCIPVETTKGGLVGNAYLSGFRLASGMQRVAKRAKADNKNIDMMILQKVFHAISCMSGGCDIIPKTVEAILLRKVADMDIAVSSAMEFIQCDENDDEFTAYDPTNAVKYFVG
tara:strand:+ start:4442 stop:5413 length:972 start_codon:yes stop_codon:yes gene_type:complete